VRKRGEREGGGEREGEGQLKIGITNLNDWSP